MHGIVVHSGAGGTSSAAERGCRRAAETGMEILRQGRSALDAVVAAVKWMEDSGTFNAGVGSILRIDGQTIQMDAVVATSSNLQGAVGAVHGVKNPILLAKGVTETPHLLLTGEGAVAFARQLGLEEHPGPTIRVQRRYESLRQAIQEGRLEAVAPGWTSEALERCWGSLDGALLPVPHCAHCDTVGAVALDTEGVFALAGSTGGSSLMLPGRVGDVPVRRCGYQIGPLGGVLATGIGEEIIRQEGSGRVYQFLEMALPAQRACEQAVLLFPENIQVGFIALTREAVGIAANCPMASHSITEE